MKVLVIDISSPSLAHKAAAHLATFRANCGHKPFVLSHKKYIACCDAGLLEYSKHFHPRKNTYCIIVDDFPFRSYKTVDLMRTAYSDFEAGWKACLGKENN